MQRYNEQLVLIENEQEKLRKILKEKKFRYVSSPHDFVSGDIIAYWHEGQSHGRNSKHFVKVKRANHEIAIQVITNENFKQKKFKANQEYVYKENGEQVPKELEIQCEDTCFLQKKKNYYIIDPKSQQKRYVLTRKNYLQFVRRRNSSEKNEVVVTKKARYYYESGARVSEGTVLKFTTGENRKKTYVHQQGEVVVPVYSALQNKKRKNSLPNSSQESSANPAMEQPKNKKRRIEELEPQTSNSSVHSNEPSIMRSPYSLFAPTQLVKPSDDHVVPWEKAMKCLHSENVDTNDPAVKRRPW